LNWSVLQDAYQECGKCEEEESSDISAVADDSFLVYGFVKI